jgi:3-deoxy-D-manno-octulosonate 8-phosphate phosphatase (KDO 8-P phosphatase)
MLTSEEHYFKLFRAATAVVMDVDGVLTDGSLLVPDDGEPQRIMNIRDGYAMQLAVRKGLKIGVITGGKSSGVERRLRGLGIQNVTINSDDKTVAFNQLVTTMGLIPESTIYIGDDMPDLKVMKLCGVPCCPFDAIPEILSFSKYISPVKGGRGCVRDILEKVLKLQHKWE